MDSKTQPQPEEIPKDGKLPDGYVETYHPVKGKKMMVRTAAAPPPAKKKKDSS